MKTEQSLSYPGPSAKRKKQKKAKFETTDDGPGPSFDMTPYVDECNILYYTPDQLEIASRYPNLYPFVFTQISSARIDFLDTVGTTNSVVRTYADIATNDLFGNGMIVQKNKTLIPDKELRALCQIHTPFGKQLIKTAFNIGFAFYVLKKDAKLKMIPKLLPMSTLDVYVHQTPYNQRVYRVTQRSNGIASNNPYTFLNNVTETNSSLLGVHVFEMDPPSVQWGMRQDMPGQGTRVLCNTIRSRLATLLEDINFFNQVSSFALDAMDRKAHPSNYTEQIEEKKDVNDLNWCARPSTIHESSKKLADIKMTPLEQEQQYALSSKVWQKNMSNYYTDSIMIRHNFNASLPPEVVPLPPRHKLAKPNTADELDNFDNYRTIFEERVAAMFGVPRAFASQTAISSGESGDIQLQIYAATQQRLRNLVIPVIQTILCDIYGKNDHKNTATSGTTAQGDLDSDDEITVSLPGVTPLAKARQLYLDGVLRYDTYKHIIALETGLAPAQMNETCALSLQELNGISESAGPTNTVKTDMKHANKNTGTAVSESKTITEAMPPATGVGSQFDKKQADKNKRKKPTSLVKSKKGE